MADPSACRDWYFRPATNAFKSHGARSGNTGVGWGGGGGGGWGGGG